MEATYKAWRFLQDRVIGYAAAWTMLGVTVLAVLEIFRRYVMGSTFHWGQDAVTYFMVSTCFIYFGAAQAQRAHLAVTLLPDWLKDSGWIKVALVVRSTALLLSLLFVFGFVYWGLPGAERSMRLDRMTESMIIPLWPFHYVLLVGMAIMGITMLFQLYREVMQLFGREVFPWDRDDHELEL